MFLAKKCFQKAAILSDDVIFLFVGNFHICDILFSIPVIHPNLHIYSNVLVLNVEIKIADTIIF